MAAAEPRTERRDTLSADIVVSIRRGGASESWSDCVAVKASALIASARISFAFFASLMWPVVQQLIVDEVPGLANNTTRGATAASKARDAGGGGGGRQRRASVSGEDLTAAIDFDGGGGITGWQDASESRNVTRELVRRGHSEADIQKIWSGNLLRVWRDVEAVAASS